MSHTHIASDETLARIASALEGKNAEFPTFNAETGRYDNESIVNWLKSMRNGLCYGVRIPKGLAVQCIKLGANAGLAVPVPGKIGTPAVDPYAGVGPFFYVEANGGVDADGTPYVTAIQGDGRFARDGSAGDVFCLSPLLYFRELDLTDYRELWISDTWHLGYDLEHDAYLPDGSPRPYILRAKYAGSKGADGSVRSVSGAKVWNRTLSHNTYITACKTATTGYSGKTTYDDWYVKVMYLMKYATKNSQSHMYGCFDYAVEFQPTVAETAVKRVIASKADAAKLVVGSSVQFGTHTDTTLNDRNYGQNYDIFDGEKITRIEEYDDENSAIYFDEVAEPFDSATTCKLYTAPWQTGSCDNVEGDGSPINPMSGKEPYVIQGIEVCLGMYEALGNVVINSDGTTGWKAFVVPDTRNAATSLNDHYVDTGIILPSGDADGWCYPTHPSKTVKGLICGQGDGASTSTGMCDGHYMHKTSTVGVREWLSLGHLGSGSCGGLWCVAANYGLSHTRWLIGGRLSTTGRSKG